MNERTIQIQTNEDELLLIRQFLNDETGTGIVADAGRLAAKAALRRALEPGSPNVYTTAQTQEETEPKPKTQEEFYRQETHRWKAAWHSAEEDREHFKLCLLELGEQFATLRNESVVVQGEAAALRRALELMRPVRQQLLSKTKTTEAFDAAMATTAGRDFLMRMLDAEQKVLGKAEPLLFARCGKHMNVPQLNKAEAEGCECGACVQEAQREKSENEVDEQWLDAIAVQWKILTGKPWETKDGECREEGVQANVNTLFQFIEDLRAGAKLPSAKA